MILRNVAVRLGRRIASPSVLNPSRRTLSTSTDTQDPMNTDLLSQYKEKHSIGSQGPAPTEGASIQSSIDTQSLAADFAADLARQRQLMQSKASKANDSDEAAENWELHQTIRRRTHNLGSVIAPHYEPSQPLENPPGPEDVTLELLMASQSHLGHSTSVWNPHNQRYIFGVRQGVHIISLETTAAHLRRAAKVVEGVAYHGGLILFVGTRKGQAPIIVKAAQMAKGCHLFDKWVPGTLTNGDQILRNCEVHAIDQHDNLVNGFDEKIKDWRALKPDLVVVMNPLENYILLHECGQNNIPTIGVVDTDADPTWVTYPIAANDDSLRCIQLIAGVLGRAGENGQKLRLEAASTGTVTWKPPIGLGMPDNYSGHTMAYGVPTVEVPENEIPLVGDDVDILKVNGNWCRRVDGNWVPMAAQDAMMVEAASKRAAA